MERFRPANVSNEDKPDDLRDPAREAEPSQGEARDTADQNDVEESSKPRGRPFQAGNAGRPPGAKNRATRMLEAMLDGQADAVGRKFMELAVAGDSRCLRLAVDRLLPRRAGRPVELDVPVVTNADDLVKCMTVIIAAVNEGVLTAEEGDARIRMLDRLGKALELNEIAARIEALEARLGENKK